MYSKYKRFNKNGYIIVNIPEHPKAFNAVAGGPETYCVYEHVFVAEIWIGRSLREGEVVHHLDENRSNNSPDNLLILENPQHVKLHQWMNKNSIVPNPAYEYRKSLGCIRCLNCEIPISFGFSFCSQDCNNTYVSVNGCYWQTDISTRPNKKPSKEILELEVRQFPMTTLGEKYGVSDNAVRKWCKSYGIELPDRHGYWTKVKYGIIETN